MGTSIGLLILGIALGAVAGGLLGTRTMVSRRAAAAEAERERITADAVRDAEAVRREAQVEAREQAIKLRAEVEHELRDKRSEVAKIEERVITKEEEIDGKLTEIERREQGILDREVHLKQLQEETKTAKDEQMKELERISGLTVEEAKRVVLERSEELVRHDLGRMVRQLEEEARMDAKRRARNLVADALQRVAASHAAETTVSIVELPSDDMKGRIIGREGRNIRALENLTGVDFIIDDTPQAVVLSSFDGVRREVAKLTLGKLVEDGRIHPSRIEEMYYRSKAEIEDYIRQAGEQAVFEANCGKMHEELVKLLGRLRYRTSYGQNILKHSLECAHLAGVMASELGASVKTAKRAALLHDLGKAMTHEVEGSHAMISAQMAKRYGESQAVVHAVEAHHYEVQPQTVEAVLVIAADAISASRPGARGESLEHYIKRLETLEKIASDKKGVERVYALQAGREIRVMVKPTDIDDDAAVLLSLEIAREIEEQLEYPGQIKVTVIRESRAVEFAKSAARRRGFAPSRLGPEQEAGDLGLVVARLDGELRVHVHHVVGHEVPLQVPADQDLVEHLRVAFEHVRVALRLLEGQEQVLEDVALQDRQRLGELEVVEVPEDDDAGAGVDGVERVHEVVDDLRLCVPLGLRGAVRRLEAAEQRIVAALRVEVVDDCEDRLPTPAELADERLAARVERRIGRVDPARAEREFGAVRPRNHPRRRRRRSAGAVDERKAAVGAEDEADADVPTGLAAVRVVDGVDLPVGIRRAAGRRDRGHERVECRAAVDDAVVHRPVRILDLLQRDDVRRLQVRDDQPGQLVELVRRIARVEVLDVEGRHGELVGAGYLGELPLQAARSGHNRLRDVELEVPEAVIEDPDDR